LRRRASSLSPTLPAGCARPVISLRRELRGPHSVRASRAATGWAPTASRTPLLARAAPCCPADTHRARDAALSHRGRGRRACRRGSQGDALMRLSRSTV
jgi:hypothetical protein